MKRKKQIDEIQREAWALDTRLESGGAVDRAKAGLDLASLAGPVPALRGVVFCPADGPVGGGQHRFMEEDFALVRACGFNHVRLGLMEGNMLEDDDRPYVYKEEGLAVLDQYFAWAEKYGTRIMLDMHNAVGRAGGGDPRLWEQAEYRERLVAMWEMLARRYQGNPSICAYDLLNEPEPHHPRPTDEDIAIWGELSRLIIEKIRRYDSRNPVIVEPVGYANPARFDRLEPSGDANTIYSFHCYAPSPFHCQKRTWNPDPETHHYPGVYDGRNWNRAQLEEVVAPALAFAREHRAPLHCGEFGCVSDTPPMEDLLWLVDLLSIFHEHGIQWSMFNFMSRTSVPYYQEHFDCNLFIHYAPTDTRYEYVKKRRILEFFACQRGGVLRIGQPGDGDLTVTGYKDGSLAEVLIANKSRDRIKSVELSVGRAVSEPVQTYLLDKNFADWTRQQDLTFTEGRGEVSLPLQSIKRLTFRLEDE